METDNITNVGQLKAALADVPDDCELLFMVAAADGSAWNMAGKFCQTAFDGRPLPFAVIRLSHPCLKNLSPSAWEKAEALTT